MKWLLAAMCLTLAGCAHVVTLSPRDGGPIGSGSAQGSWSRYSGAIAVDLDGRHYDGQWVYQPSGGMIGFGSSTAFSGARSASAFGSVLGMSADGGGKAILRSADGKTLRCGFSYNQMSSTGMGECQDPDGKVYDLMIHY